MNKERTPTLDQLDERACAFQQSLVFMRQDYPNMAVMAYDNEVHQYANHLLLAKFVIGLDGEYMELEKCVQGSADNITGGLKGHCLFNGEQVRAEIYPLMLDREQFAWEGGAVIFIETDSSKQLSLRFGNGDMAFMHLSPNAAMSGSEIDCQHGECRLEGDFVLIRREERTLRAAVKGGMDFEICSKLSGGSYAEGKTNAKKTALMVGFSPDEKRAKEIASLDPEKERKKIQDYYQEKLKDWYIRTPDPQLDEAFQHALLNMEYSYVDPLGWVESFHHWPTFWHVEDVLHEVSAGNAQRVKKYFEEMERQIREEGVIPDLCWTREGRRDWGGNNQFFFRNLLQYLEMTGDIETARRYESLLEKVLCQTFEEYDPSGSGVLAWNTQIGNQEDFEATPGKGAAPGSVGVRMLEIMGEIKDVLGKKEEAEKYLAASGMALCALKKTLWLKDVGRLAWYQDNAGQTRYETTYHGICYPILYNQLPVLDQITSIDHLLHRLSGEEGEIYLTNHFADHAYWNVPTWGMQCGSDMQPIASLTYAKLGLGNEAVKPLAFIAKRVCGPYQRGSFPETANEQRFAYFSPSAALFSEGVIAGIFGVDINRLRGTFTLSPCFPEDWERAELRISHCQITYHKGTYRIQTEPGLRKIFRQKLAPFQKVRAYVNGKEATPAVKVWGNKFEVEIDLGWDPDIQLKLEITPLDFSVSYQNHGTYGEQIQVKVQGAQVVGVDDRCGLLKSFDLTEDGLLVTIGDRLLEPYEKFGWQGLINFARRTFFLKLRYEDKVFCYPCTITVVPPYVVEAKLEGNYLRVNVGEEAVLRLSGEEVPGKGVFVLTDSQLRALSTHQNKGTLYFPRREISLDFVFEAEVQTKIETIPLPKTVRPEGLFDGKTRKEEEISAVSVFDGNGKFKPHITFGHMLLHPETIMQGLFDQHSEVKILPGVPLKLNPNGFTPINWDNPLSFPLDIKAKKLYLLVSAFCDNHDAFATLADLYILAKQGKSYIKGCYHRELTFPGQLDMGFSNENVYGFATYVEGVDKKFVPRLPDDTYGDYPDAKPYAYPQRGLWTPNLSMDLCHTVVTLLEMDLGEYVELEEMKILPRTTECAIALLAVSAQVEE